MNSGITGSANEVSPSISSSSSSMMDGPGLPGPGEFGVEADSSSPNRDDLGEGECRLGMLMLIIRVSAVGVIDCPARGEAVTVVPALAMGAGCGLDTRKRG